MKPIIRFLMLALLALQLTGCGGGSDDPDQPPSDAGAHPPNCTANPKACI